MRVALALVSLLLALSIGGQAPQDKFFDSNGVQIRYVEQGTGDPVLLIHGYTRSIETNWIEPGSFKNSRRTIASSRSTCAATARAASRTTRRRTAAKP